MPAKHDPTSLPRLLRRIDGMDWFHDGRDYHHDDLGPGEDKITSLPYGADYAVRVEFPDGPVVFAETRFWTHELVSIHWHDDRSEYCTLWVPAEWVHRATAEEHSAGLHEQYERVMRRLSADWKAAHPEGGD